MSLEGSAARVQIDENLGRIGVIALGQSASAVKKRLSMTHLFLARWVGGPDLIYCSVREGAYCVGPTVQVRDACALKICPDNATEGIGRIDLSAGVPRRSSSAWGSIKTLRGIHLFSPKQAVLARYKIADVGPGICASMPSPSTTYVALAGQNSIAFTVYKGTVWQISVQAGFHLACP